MKNFLIFIFLVFPVFAADRPNIILILTDDMGYSDLGCFGGEISTPNLDGLAEKGIRMTHFYNTGRCCPSRASLLTGRYSHNVGFGHMDSNKGKKYPGYVGHLTGKTIAETLSERGYYTLMTGKWHQGSKVKAHWPLNKGFKNFYGVPQGGGFYFDPGNMYSPRQVVRDFEVVYDKKKSPPKGWYATDAFTEEAFPYLKKSITDKKPFFWYLAYNAPHFPLQAKDSDIEKYRGKYKKPWQDFRIERFNRQREMGLLREGDMLSPVDSKIPNWNKLSDTQKDLVDLRMATYAAMIDNVDQNVGKIIKFLKEQSAYENTLIIFINDNGADSSGGMLGKDKKGTVCGKPGSFSFAGQAWANVSNTPFRLYKKWNHEGGVTNPAILHWPKGFSKKGIISHEKVHMIDIAPTLMKLTGAATEEALDGIDISSALHGEGLKSRPLFFEHEGNCAIIKGDWKLVRVKGKSWELYNVAKDRSEMDNKAGEYPQKVKELKSEWNDWAHANKVFPSPFIKSASSK